MRYVVHPTCSNDPNIRCSPLSLAFPFLTSSSHALGLVADLHHQLALGAVRGLVSQHLLCGLQRERGAGVQHHTHLLLLNKVADVLQVLNIVRARVIWGCFPFALQATLQRPF